MAGRAPRTPDGPPPPPVVCKLRARYAKRGRLRFTSSRDIARVFERAVRRAGVPIAHSAGFSPHPKLSWVGAAPTGVASEAEYVEIGLTAYVDPDATAAALDRVLPPGLDVCEAVLAGPGSLADRMEASVWELRLPGADRAEVEKALAAFRAADVVPVARRTKSGIRDVDTRGPSLVWVIREADEPGCVILRGVVRHTTPVVRPDDVLAGMRAVAPLELGSPLVATRLAQGPLRADHSTGLDVEEFGVGDPLAPDRANGGGDPRLSA